MSDTTSHEPTPPTAPSGLSLHDVADSLGVHYMTAYRYIRLGMLPAARVGRSWIVTEDDLEAFRRGNEHPVTRGNAPWSDRLLNRMLAADDAGAWSVVEAAMAAGMAPPDVHTTVISPALRSVGSLWEHGDIDVSAEHAASQVAARVIARLGPQMTHRGLRRGTIVVGSTQAELHDLPIAILADLLRAERFEVVDLGANLPASSFAAAVARADDVVVAAIGVTTPGQERAVIETVDAIRSVSEVAIIVGGAAAPRDLADREDIAAVTATTDDVLAAIEAIMSAR